MKFDWSKIAKIAVAAGLGVGGTAVAVDPAAADWITQLLALLPVILAEVVPDPELRTRIIGAVSALAALVVAFYKYRKTVQAKAAVAAPAAPAISLVPSKPAPVEAQRPDEITTLFPGRRFPTIDEVEERASGSAMFVSAQQEAPMSEKKTITVNDLELFPRISTRAEFQKTFGMQAPPWNPNRPKKFWADLGAKDDEMKTYKVFNAETGQPGMYSISGDEANEYNLPGAYRYDKWEPAPTTAYQIVPNQGFQPIPPEVICLKSEALELAAEIGVTDPNAVVESKVNNNAGKDFFPENEKRRHYTVMFKGNGISAGALLKQKHQYGVGAPIVWDLSGTMPWANQAPQVTGENDARPEVPAPIRDLLPGERFIQGFGGQWLVTTEAATAEAPATGITASLERIEEMLERLMHFLAVPAK